MGDWHILCPEITSPVIVNVGTEKFFEDHPL